MDKLDIILWVIGIGFTFNFALMWILYSKIERLDEKMTDIDRRLCRLEGAFSAKECCMLTNRDSRRVE